MPTPINAQGAHIGAWIEKFIKRFVSAGSIQIFDLNKSVSGKTIEFSKKHETDILDHKIRILIVSLNMKYWPNINNVYEILLLIDAFEIAYAQMREVISMVK